MAVKQQNEILSQRCRLAPLRENDSQYTYTQWDRINNPEVGGQRE